MLPKFIENCNRLLSAAGRSGRFSEMHGALCTHSTCRSTMPACQLFAKWFRSSNGHL